MSFLKTPFGNTTGSQSTGRLNDPAVRAPRLFEPLPDYREEADSQEAQCDIYQRLANAESAVAELNDKLREAEVFRESQARIICNLRARVAEMEARPAMVSQYAPGTTIEVPCGYTVIDQTVGERLGGLEMRGEWRAITTKEWERAQRPPNWRPEGWETIASRDGEITPGKFTDTTIGKVVETVTTEPGKPMVRIEVNDARVFWKNHPRASAEILLDIGADPKADPVKTEMEKVAALGKFQRYIHSYGLQPAPEFVDPARCAHCLRPLSRSATTCGICGTDKTRGEIAGDLAAVGALANPPMFVTVNGAAPMIYHRSAAKREPETTCNVHFTPPRTKFDAFAQAAPHVRQTRAARRADLATKPYGWAVLALVDGVAPNPPEFARIAVTKDQSWSGTQRREIGRARVIRWVDDKGLTGEASCVDGSVKVYPCAGEWVTLAIADLRE